MWRDCTASWREVLYPASSLWRFGTGKALALTKRFRELNQQRTVDTPSRGNVAEVEITDGTDDGNGRQIHAIDLNFSFPNELLAHIQAAVDFFTLAQPLRFPLLCDRSCQPPHAGYRRSHGAICPPFDFLHCQRRFSLAPQHSCRYARVCPPFPSYPTL